MGRAQEHAEWTFDTDKDLEEVWPEVIRKYEEITKEKLDANTSLADFQTHIERGIERSVTKSHQHTRKVLNNIGLCLETFGSIIAQGASIVFGPASQCWNAISFVIQAGRKVSEILEGFVVLMERSAVFLTRLNFYLKQECGQGGSRLPQHLRKSAYDILTHFLGVLASSYALATSKRERWKLMVGVVLFNSDAGVATSLSRMEERIADFTHASIDQIAADVKGLALYLRKSDEERNRHYSEIQEYVQANYKVTEQVLDYTQEIKATVDGRATKDQHRDDKVTIAKNLAVRKVVEEESWDKQHRDVCKAHVEGTGRWIEKDEGFVQWSDINNHTTKVFVLKADHGYGKTHVSSHVISHLNERYRAGSVSSPVFVAYYYYRDDKDESLERCLGSIIYQFAAADVGYATAVANACDRSSNVASARDRWTHLVLAQSSFMKGTYFICIDGFDSRGQLDQEEATISAMTQRALEKANASGVTIRLFLSGTAETLSRVPQPAEGVRTVILGPIDSNTSDSISTLGRDELSPTNPFPNESDLEAVTRSRVAELCKAEPDLKGLLREANIKLLIEGTRGNYNHLESKIIDIKSCETEEQVQDIINNTSTDMKTSERNNLRALDTSLNPSQVRRLNDLLVWVAGVRYGVTVKFCQSALYFTFRENLRLESEIRNTYQAVLKIREDGVITFKSDEIRDILTESAAQDPDTSTEGPQQEDISLAEISLCRRFIKNACPSLDYTRFKFDEFFDAMAHKTHLHLGDENTLNLSMLSTCVSVLCETGDDKNLQELREYASIWFYEHLKTLVENFDSFEPNRQSLSDVGRKVVDLFFEPELIDAWFLEKSLGLLKYDWIEKDDFIDPLKKFLRNPHVAKGYMKDAKKAEWVKKVLSDAAPKVLILERIAARLAYRWFSAEVGPEPEFLTITYGIVAKIAGKDFEEGEPVSLQEVDNFIKWVKTEPFKIDDHIFAYRKGATYYAFEHDHEAVKAYEEAQQHPQAVWSVNYGLLLAYERLKDYPAALKYIQKFKLLSDQFLATDKKFKTVWWDVLLSEGNCYRKCQDCEPAAECFRAILDQKVDDELWPGRVHTEALSALFTTWAEMKSYRSIIDYVRSWRDIKDKTRDASYWFQKTIWADKVHGCIIAAAKRSEAVDDVCSLYQEVIDKLPSSIPRSSEEENGPDPSAKGQLRYYQAALRFHGSRVDQKQDHGIQTWEEIIEKSEEPTSFWWAAIDAARKLAPALLDKALVDAASPSPDSLKSYGSRLTTLAKMNSTVIRYVRQGQKDPRLCLIRLQHVKGNSKSAFAEARDRLISVFDNWPKSESDDSVELRIKNLAQTLTVLDKDADAVAAWQLTKPPKQRKVSTIDTASGKDADFANSDSCPNQSDSTPAVAVDKAQDDQETSASTTVIPRAYISQYWCDAACGTTWKTMLADCYVCKHCLCVQLCPSCYQKLQDDDLDPLICNKNHQMLYLPPFDQATWHTLPPDMIILDKQPASRVDWLDRIKDEFKVQQEQIDVLKIERVKEITSWTSMAVMWRRWRNRVLKNRPKATPVAPTIRRVQTVR